MALSDDLIPVAREARGIAGTLGFRPHTVERITRFKSGSIRDFVSAETIAIVEGNGQPPRVRWMSEEEVTIGSLAKGTIEIGAITPSDALDEWLRGDGMAAGDERYIRITGPKTRPSGDLYRVKSWNAARPLRRMIQAEPVEQGGP